MRPCVTVWLLVGLAGLLVMSAGAAPSQAMDLRPVRYADIAGWPDDRHGEALAVFRRSCERILRGSDSDPLAGPCRAAQSTGAGDMAARTFFESWFRPLQVLAGGGDQGLFTGYFEPELEADRQPSAAYPVPLLAPPRNLVALKDGTDRGPVPASFSHAISYGGRYHVAPTRSEIEAGILGDAAPAIAWLADPVDAFFLHVQGSGRLRYPDGSSERVAYAAKNGHPYTSIGKVLVDRGVMTRDAVSMASLREWLLSDPPRGRSLMQENRSYIFFRRTEDVPGFGPHGQQGVPLTAGRSLAVDLGHHRTGLPIWLETMVPGPGGAGLEPLRRLMVAQDTGSAIRGPIRGDVFFGSGIAAGERAGAMRSMGRMIVLSPREAE